MTPIKSVSRKWSALFLAVLAALSLAACQGSAKPKNLICCQCDLEIHLPLPIWH